jgi:glyoxylase-like metal-dependent hydrolase (beta-lactamase superfamily II)
VVEVVVCEQDACDVLEVEPGGLDGRLDPVGVERRPGVDQREAVLLADEDGLTLVDAGTPFDADRVEAAVDAAGFDREDIARILLTHYDLDHVGSVAKLAVDAPVYIGTADADYLTGARRPGISGLKPAIQTAVAVLIPDVPADRVRRVGDGDVIGGFTAYHTPGHTPGHVAYVHEARDVAVLGDAVIERGGSLRASPWYLSYDAGRAEDSVVAFAERAPEVQTLGMGHGTPVEADGAERLSALTASL